MRRLLTLIIFIVLSLIYYFLKFEEFETTKTILTVASFLFAIFTGFFISRQGRRYNNIRATIANFDGDVSALYRIFGHAGAKIKDEAAAIIKSHYDVILKNHAWDYQFTHKSETITKLHTLVDNEKFQSKKWLTRPAMSALNSLQKGRKQMVVLQLERVPAFQWILIIVLCCIMLITLAFLPSLYPIFFALLKGAFGTAIVIVLVMLYEFDRLRFFEGVIGEKSARDVLDIVKGKK
tara:strand:+ start:640 stop:1347 length:708 start_codon:yes stop_codon:yes gene_type:complete